MGAERSENRKRTMSNTHVKPKKSLTLEGIIFIKLGKK
jgi:hypothetical protein